MSGRTVKFTSSQPWAAGRFDGPFLVSLLILSLPARRRPHWWLAVCCEPLARLGELGFDRAERGRDRCGIGLSHKTQTCEASKVKHPLRVYGASRRSWGCWRLRYGPGLQRWASRVPASGLFVGMPDTQEGAFLPGPPNELHARRETCARKTTGHGEGREAGEAHRARQTAHVSLW